MLCKDSWIDISWDGLPKRRRQENLKVIFTQRTSTVMSFHEACDKTAVEISSKYKNLYVAFSGGCDSENVCNVFLRNHIPFTPIILVYDHVKYDFQRLESGYALEWCQRHKIKPMIVKTAELVDSIEEKFSFLDIKPRLYLGHITTTLLKKIMDDCGGNLVTGYQLEYYPDHEQMTYLEPQLGDYVGFVMEETDNYLETMIPNRHPWAFHYWNPDIVAAFVNEWDTSLTMQENKAKIYQVSHRPKRGYPDMLSMQRNGHRKKIASQFGTVDCGLLGTKETLLASLRK